MGSKLEFEIVYSEDEAVRAKGTVVRVQEPSWLGASGSAVQFDWIEQPDKLTSLVGNIDYALAVNHVPRPERSHEVASS